MEKLRYYEIKSQLNKAGIEFTSNDQEKRIIRLLIARSDDDLDSFLSTLFNPIDKSNIEKLVDFYLQPAKPKL